MCQHAPLWPSRRNPWAYVLPLALLAGGCALDVSRLRGYASSAADSAELPSAGGLITSGGGSGWGGTVGAGGVAAADGSVGSGGAPSGAGGIGGAGGASSADAPPGGSGGSTGGSSLGTGGAGGTGSADAPHGGSGGSTGGSIGSGGAIGSGGTTSSGGTGGNAPIILTGTCFGSGPPNDGNPAYGYAMAFDGNINTFDDDSTASYGWTGIDLGEGAAVRVVHIRYYPRTGWDQEGRMVGGRFQCSSTSQTDGYKDLYVIPSAPPDDWTDVDIASSLTCRYLRYLGPAWSHTNVAEIQFWGF